MSVQSIGAALLVPDITPSTKLVLVGLANHDGPGGCWVGIKLLAKYANVSERQTKRCLSDLVDRGLIRVERNAGGTENTRPDQRPNRYHLTLDGVTPTSPRNVKRGDTHDTPSPSSTAVTPTSPREHNGVTPVTERGDTHVTNGVTPMSPEPSLNRLRTPTPFSDMTQQRAALLHRAGDLMIKRKAENGEMIRSRTRLAAHLERELEREQPTRLRELIERMDRCKAAGQTIDLDAFAAVLIEPTDESSKRRLAAANPDPALAHDTDCDRCNGDEWIDTGAGLARCTGAEAVA